MFFDSLTHFLPKKKKKKKKKRFLTEQGYLHNTLPDDYLNTPPADMASALANQALLGEIIAEEGKRDGKYGVEKFIAEVVGEVHEVVDGLKEEMELMIGKKWEKLLLELGWDGVGGDGGETMKRDYEYLVKMKEMDEEIGKEKREGVREKKKIELSVVVPAAGLVMARFHVYNCELNTAISHWDMEERKSKERGEVEMAEKDGEKKEETEPVKVIKEEKSVWKTSSSLRLSKFKEKGEGDIPHSKHRKEGEGKKCT